MARKNNILLLFIFSILLLVGCKSSKTVPIATSKADIEQIKSMPAFTSGMDGISAKMRLTVNINGKTVSSSGNIKVKRGEGVQLSITPLGIFEAARVEFLPLYVLYINKIEAEYAQVDYSAISLLKEHGIGVSQLESLLLNKVYIPAGLSADKLLAASVITNVTGGVLVSYQVNDVTYEYHIDKSTGLLVKSVGTHKNGISLSCTYENFEQVGEVLFPASIELDLAGVTTTANLLFSLGRVKENGVFTPTKPSASYKRVSAASLLKLLGGK